MGGRHPVGGGSCQWGIVTPYSIKDRVFARQSSSQIFVRTPPGSPLVLTCSPSAHILVLCKPKRSTSEFLPAGLVGNGTIYFSRWKFTRGHQQRGSFKWVGTSWQKRTMTTIFNFIPNGTIALQWKKLTLKKSSHWGEKNSCQKITQPEQTG